MRAYKTEWVCNTKTESIRILTTAKSVSDGFFEQMGFIVLPYGTRHISSKAVILPDLDYRSIPSFWGKCKSAKLNRITANNPTVLETHKLLIQSDIPLPDSHNPLQDEWEKHNSNIMKHVFSIYPAAEKMFDSLTIYPTNFGTTTSFYSVGNQIRVFLRSDADIYTLIEAILSLLTRSRVFKKYKAMWSESEFLVDWLIGESAIGEYLRNNCTITSFNPTTRSIRENVTPRVSTESQNFLEKLGVVHTSSSFKLTAKLKITYKGKRLRELTEREQKLLKYFITHKSKIITPEEIGAILFTDIEDYSLYAISKAIQRLRQKLYINDVSTNFIQNVRGEGYILRD